MRRLSIKKESINIYYIVMGIFFLCFGLRLVVNCIYGVPSFDGAMNLQVPLQLLESGKYMTSYDGGIIFDPRIQTKMPVLIPIYILWKLFGVSTTSALVVNAAYMCLMMYATYKICRELGFEKQLSMIPVMLLTVIPSIWTYGFGIYGEIPTAALFLMSVLYLIKSEKSEKQYLEFLLAGIYFSLAFLNKTVILIAVPALAVVFIYKIFIDKKTKFTSLILGGTAFICPIIVAELYHIAQLGDLQQYLTGLKSEFFDVGRQAGVSAGFSDTLNIFEKIWTHLEILSKESILFHPILIVLILVAIFIAWIYLCCTRKKITYFSVIVLVMFSYFGWWLAITTTQKAWYRRIIIGVILLFIVSCVVSFYYAKSEKIRRILVYIGLAVGIVISTHHIIEANTFNKELKTEVIQLADKVKEISKENENAKFYGYGWYQAPAVSLCAETEFWNLYNSKIENDCAYLVLDKDSYAGASSGIESILRCFETELVLKNSYGAIYKIGDLNYEGYTGESELEDVPKTEIATMGYYNEEGYSGIIGIHGFEGDPNARWSSPNLEILLNNPGCDTLKVSLNVVALEKMNNDKLTLYFYVDDVLVSEEEITSNGGYTFTLSGEQVAKEGIRNIRILADSYVKTTEDSRLLSFRFVNIYYVSEE